MIEKDLPTPPRLDELPPDWPGSLTHNIRQALIASEKTIVVLDDDPTGTQTVQDVPVLTQFGAAQISNALAECPPVLFLSTNSRSLTSAETITLHHDIVAKLKVVSEGTNRQIEIISRSDSTLRGHYPEETDTVLACWPQQGALSLLMPFFLEGGRLTIAGRHYVLEHERLVPANQTPFAKDAVFGFQNSYLPDYVEEKTRGRVRAGDVTILPLELIRAEGPAGVQALLDRAPTGSVCVADGVTDKDAQVVAAAVAGCSRPILARVAASYVRARAGLEQRPLLTAIDLGCTGASASGGLVVVGSHVPKSTAQLEALLRSVPECVPIEVPVDQLVAADELVTDTTTDAVNDALHANRDVVLFTSRHLVSGSNERDNQEIGKCISEGLVRVVQSLRCRPRYLVAKGGITSSVLATRGLHVERAVVAGSILPGVPVWRLGPETRFPNLHYVIFPGNVGDDDALATVVAELKKI